MQEGQERIGQNVTRSTTEIRVGAGAIEILLGVVVLLHEGGDRRELPDRRIVGEVQAVDLRGHQIAVAIIIGDLPRAERDRNPGNVRRAVLIELDAIGRQRRAKHLGTQHIAQRHRRPLTILVGQGQTEVGFQLRQDVPVELQVARGQLIAAIGGVMSVDVIQVTIALVVRDRDLQAGRLADGYIDHSLFDIVVVVAIAEIKVEPPLPGRLGALDVDNAADAVAAVEDA